MENNQLTFNYPTFFGVSCAFVALHAMKKKKTKLDLENYRWANVAELMLRGSLQLLGLVLMERLEKRVSDEENSKLKKAELEIAELKLRRVEDAKANEKVVGIFAAHEQSWITERKRLALQLQAVSNELRNVRNKYEEMDSELNKRIVDGELLLRDKEEAMVEEAEKRKEAEERLKVAEEVVEQLRERVNKEAQEHSAELWKHKTLFVEAVSNQRQLEADLNRAVRQTEALQIELDAEKARNEEEAGLMEKISAEAVKLRQDAEQKDKILSAMLRKSKLDTAEKQVLLKEVKMARAKKKQVELEADRLREGKQRKGSSSVLYSLEAGCSHGKRDELKNGNGKYNTRTLLLDYFEAENRNEQDRNGDKFVATCENSDRYSSEGNDEPAPLEDIHQLRDWVRQEAEKYAAILEERHYEEIEAFTEQMRLKDEKLELLKWKLLSMEVESKQLQSHIEGLDGSLCQLKEDNLRLEAILMEKDKEVKSLKEQFSFHLQYCQKRSSPNNFQALWSEVKITRRKSAEKHQQEAKFKSAKVSQITDKTICTMSAVSELKSDQCKVEINSPESVVVDYTTYGASDGTPPRSNYDKHAIACIDDQGLQEFEKVGNSSDDKEQSPVLIIHNHKGEDIEEEKEVSIDPVHVQKQSSSEAGTSTSDKLLSPEQCFMKKDSTWKMDIHALGVSYKIKRLKQQLIVLEKLVGLQIIKETTVKDDASHASGFPDKRKLDDNSKNGKGFVQIMSLLNKQVQRYQSLEEKTDNLCRIMHENSRTGSRRDLLSGRSKQQTKALQGFLEETFQLQRFMVATGQKLMEVQSRIASSFVSSDGLEKSAGINIGQFADVVRTLFREIQRGLEVRIARIIGDLEGTLASDGILR